MDILQKTCGRVEKRKNINNLFLYQGNNDKINFRPISLLPVISKKFERVLHKKIEKFAKNVFTSCVVLEHNMLF